MSYNRGTKYRIRAITVAYTVQEAGLVVVLPKFLTTRISSFRVIFNLVSVVVLVHHNCETNRYLGIARKLVNYFPSKSLIRLSSRLLAFIWGAKQPERISSFRVIFNLVSVCYGFSTGNRYLGIVRKLGNYFPFKSLIHLSSRLLAFIWGAKQPEWISSFRFIFNLVHEHSKTIWISQDMLRTYIRNIYISTIFRSISWDILMLWILRKQNIWFEDLEDQEDQEDLEDLLGDQEDQEDLEDQEDQEDLEDPQICHRIWKYWSPKIPRSVTGFENLDP